MGWRREGALFLALAIFAVVFLPTSLVVDANMNFPPMVTIQFNPQCPGPGGNPPTGPGNFYDQVNSGLPGLFESHEFHVKIAYDLVATQHIKWIFQIPFTIKRTDDFTPTSQYRSTFTFIDTPTSGGPPNTGSFDVHVVEGTINSFKTEFFADTLEPSLFGQVRGRPQALQAVVINGECCYVAGFSDLMYPFNPPTAPSTTVIFGDTDLFAECEAAGLMRTSITEPPPPPPIIAPPPLVGIVDTDITDEPEEAGTAVLAVSTFTLGVTAVATVASVTASSSAALGVAGAGGGSMGGGITSSSVTPPDATFQLIMGMQVFSMMTYLQYTAGIDAITLRVAEDLQWVTGNIDWLKHDDEAAEVSSRRRRRTLLETYVNPQGMSTREAWRLFFNKVISIAFLFVLVILLHCFILQLWEKYLMGKPLPLLLAFPGFELMILMIVYTPAVEAGSILVGTGTASSVIVGLIFLIIVPGGILYIFWRVVSILPDVGVEYEEVEAEVTSQSQGGSEGAELKGKEEGDSEDEAVWDPVHSALFQGKKRVEGRWRNKVEKEEEGDADEKNKRLLDISEGLNVTFEVLCKNRSSKAHRRSTKATTVENGKASDVEAEGGGGGGEVAASGDMKPSSSGNSDTSSDCGEGFESLFRDSAYIERFGCCFDMNRGHQTLTRYFVVIALAAQGALAFALATEAAAHQNVSTTMIWLQLIIPASAMLIRGILALACRPQRNRLQWLDVVLYSILLACVYIIITIKHGLDQLGIVSSFINSRNAFIVHMVALGLKIMLQLYGVIINFIHKKSLEKKTAREEEETKEKGQVEEGKEQGTAGAPSGKSAADNKTRRDSSDGVITEILKQIK